MKSKIILVILGILLTFNIFIYNYKSFIYPTKVQILTYQLSYKVVDKVISVGFKKIEESLYNNILNESVWKKLLSNYSTPVIKNIKVKLNVPKLIYEQYCGNNKLVKVYTPQYGIIYLYCDKIKNISSFEEFVDYVYKQIYNQTGIKPILEDVIGLVKDIYNTVTKSMYKVFIKDILNRLLDKRFVEEKLNKIKEALVANITPYIYAFVIKKLNNVTCNNFNCIIKKPQFLISKKFYEDLEKVNKILIIINVILAIIYLYLKRDIKNLILVLLVASIINLVIIKLLEWKKNYIFDIILKTNELLYKYKKDVIPILENNFSSFLKNYINNVMKILIFSLTSLGILILIRYLNEG